MEYPDINTKKIVSCFGNSLFFMPKERLIGVIKVRQEIKYSDEYYIKRLSEFPIQVLPIEPYINYSTKIQHRCVKCGKIIMIEPGRVLYRLKQNYTICQYCGGKKLIVGKNDLWTTNPDIASMLLNPNDGYRTTKGSTKKFDWRCKECGTIVRQKSVNNTVRNGLCCPICSSGRSMGHRIVNAILEVCQIEFQNEVEFGWSDKKRYDIFANNNCIIEVNGEQHYADCYMLKVKNRSLKDEQYNDKLKRDLAIRNGIEYYITVDGRYSDYDYIVSEIKNNKPFIDFINKCSKTKFDDINWLDVFEKYNDKIAWRILRLYNQKWQIKDIAAEVKINHGAVSKYLKLLSKYGFCTYNPASQIKRKVRCITTGEEFDSMNEAGEKYHIKPVGIYRVCNNMLNRTTAGKLDNGTRLQWEYI